LEKIMQEPKNFFTRFNVQIAIFLLCFFVLLPILKSLPAEGVGDGSEYYGMGIAWKETLRPYMTPISWDAYQSFVDSGRVKSGLFSAETLSVIFPDLKINQTNDFNHFWFYSLLAGIIGRFFLLLGSNVSIHSCFLVVHTGLLSLTLMTSYHYYKLKGLFVVLFLVAASPIIWYLDKVHTEFFTFSLTIMAVMSALYGDYHISALYLALASTQNPSFAIVSLLSFAIFLYKNKLKEINLTKIIVVLLSLLVISLHPVYYLWRYGVLTPQMLAGGADMGDGLKYFYIWIIDPDLGLIPNWLPGLPLAGLGFWFLLKSRNINYSFLFFCIMYIVISLFAQSSTGNLNSGATPGLARYALWYLCLFFPILIHIVQEMHWKPLPVLIGITIGITSIIINYELLNRIGPFGGAGTPSIISRFIQTHAPRLYNPPPEVFAERYGGVGEDVWQENTIAVIGPDCEKFLYLNWKADNEPYSRLLLPKECGFEYSDALSFFNSGLRKQAIPYYDFLSLEEKSIFTNGRKDYAEPVYVNNHMPNAALDKILINGWSTPEIWGIWSIGNNSKIRLIEPSPEANGNWAITLFLQPVLLEGHSSTTLSISINRERMWSGALTQLSEITLPLSPLGVNQAVVDIEFVVENPISPLQLGVSTDDRLLGVGLIGYQFTR
jgi:hypothetical protein